MTVTVVPMFDATHDGIGGLPPGQAAGYTTGSGGIAWTPADWAAHPGAVRIDQDASARDGTADVLDVENGAATPAECPGWYRAALAAYQAGTRPGQRWPAIYCNMSTLPSVANALVAAGITAGPKLWLAQPWLTQPAAAALVAGGGGPWPVVAVQWKFAGSYDASAASQPWLQAVSGPPPPPPPPPAPPADVTVTWTLPVLAQGAAGGPVATVQGLLGARGHPVVIDGQFGPATASAVRAVQAAAHVTADAVVGGATWKALAGQ